MSWRSKTYEVLPALSVRGSELRKNMRTITLAWIFGITWMTCTAGSRIVYFGRMVGFTNFHFGVLSAFPFVSTFGQLIAAVIIERTGLRKFQFLHCASIHRMLWLAVAAVPLLLPIPSALAVWSVIFILSASSFLNALAIPAWWNWMGDVIPRRIRGRYFADRARITQAVRIPVVIGLALLMDAVTRPDAPITAAAQPMLLWCILGVFVVAAIVGTIDILLFHRIREVLPPSGDKGRAPAVNIVVKRPAGRGPLARPLYALRYCRAAVGQLLLDPLGDRVFRSYVIYGATITFAMAVAGPFFWRNCLENLGFSQLATDVLFLVVGPAAAILSLPWIGRLIDRWGRRPVLMFGTFVAVFSVVPYFLASRQAPTPQFLAYALNGVSQFVGSMFGRGDWRWVAPGTPVIAWLIMAASPLLGGVGWNAIALAQQGIILGFSDGHGRSKYIAASAVLISFGGIVGGLAGGIVAHQLRHFQLEPLLVGPLVWNNWHATFALSMLARITALGLLIRMPDPGSGNMRDFVRYLRGNVYNYLATRLFMPLRIFGWGRAARRNKSPKRDRK